MLHMLEKPSRIRSRRRLQSVGLCSTPLDEHDISEICTPVNNSTNCYVMNGGVTVIADGDDNQEDLIDAITAIIEDAMDDDVLDDRLINVHPEVVDVAFEDSDEPIVVGATIERSKGAMDSGAGAIVGMACAAAIILLIGLFFLLRKRKHIEKVVTEEVIEGHEIPVLRIEMSSTDDSTESESSFINVDSRHLGKIATCMDVHQCKSATCAKCYKGLNVDFIPISKTKEPTKIDISEMDSLSFSVSEGTDDFWFGK